MGHSKSQSTIVPLGIGYYTVPEAARLLSMKATTIRRWLGGYQFRDKQNKHQSMTPLWDPQIPRIDGKLELGFRDLIELRFVNAFTNSGVDLRVIRACLETARECVGDERPFSTRLFRTDGRTIYLDSLRRLEDNPEIDGREVIDLRKQQYVFANILDKFLKTLILKPIASSVGAR